MAWKNKCERNAYERRKYLENPQKTIKRTTNYLNNTLMGRACRLVNNYRWMDKKANRGQGDLTAKWVAENILTKPCAHCGESDWHNIGCNRLNNDLPHTMDNVEPCCEHCNHVLGGKCNGKKVFQYTIDGELVKIWSSASEAAKQLNFNVSHIVGCCNGKRKTHKGYKWSYEPL